MTKLPAPRAARELLTASDIVRRRLHGLGLDSPRFEHPAEVVRALGAMQSQDHGSAKWSVAQRTRRPSQEDFDSAFAAGEILRTHILRPTWHFVVPEDIRWMQMLTAPRVKPTLLGYCRRSGLDQTLLDQCSFLVAETLADGTHLTRKELGAVFARAGIMLTAQATGFALMHAELDCLICSGAMKGPWHTYALLELRAPAAATLDRNEALGELTRRYFTGHGPATVKDFVWWSSLTTADAKRGLDVARNALDRAEVDGEMYWFREPSSRGSEHAARTGDGHRKPGTRSQKRATAHLLQSFDELIVGYAESKYLLDPSGVARASRADQGIYAPSVIFNGRLAGSWKRSVEDEEVTIELSLYRRLSGREVAALQEAAQTYATFLGASAASVNAAAGHDELKR
jgi:hypothetical protein